MISKLVKLYVVCIIVPLLFVFFNSVFLFPEILWMKTEGSHANDNRTKILLIAYPR